MPPKIVCLDGYASNPGDLSWAPFEKLGDFAVHDRSAPDEVVERAADSPHILINKVQMTDEIMARLPNLRYIGVLATGFNSVDAQAAGRRNITVTNVPRYSTDSVAQHATALLLELVRQVAAHDQAVQRGQWQQSADFCFSVAPIIELTGKTLGIVGFGQIGRAFARIAAAMGMHIRVAHYRELSADELRDGQAQQVPMDELFAESDVISLHCPLTPQTENLVNGRRLQLMKPAAFLINTSRGPLVDENALAVALREKRIEGAAVDVLCEEPPSADNPLIGLDNCIITPHIAWYAKAARQRLMDIAAENLRGFLQGELQNVVNERYLSSAGGQS